MSFERSKLLELLEQMQEATGQAISFLDGIEKPQFFLRETRTQMAVSMALVILGEAVTRAIKSDPHITDEHPNIPWMKIKATRNLVADDYFELEFDVVWKTVKEDLPHPSRNFTLCATFMPKVNNLKCRKPSLSVH